ncbi:hypothetical protein PRIPAC_82895, partial [Pristionchus pacificus]|uniref:Uncharacterized protein n=1 Tax=Pristionchus pacificus TaxID=54126 RepID=A0A2A6C1W8_PRIPA
MSLALQSLEKDCDYANELIKEPELNWLIRRGGTLFIFGDYGKPPFLIYELYALGITLFTCAPPALILLVQSMYALKMKRKTLSLLRKTI